MNHLRTKYCHLSRSLTTRRFYYVETPNQSVASPNDNLYRRITRAGSLTPSIIAVLENWLREGKEATTYELRTLIRQLGKLHRYHHALEISEWISDKRNNALLASDIATQLELIARVHSLDQADKYFDSIPDTMKVSRVYGALLNSYARCKSLEKAEAIMQKMKELKLLKTAPPYNGMLNMYSRSGNYEKLDILMQEMEEMGINWDIFTYSIRLNAHSATSDVEKMEKLLLKMEVDPYISMNWNTYAIAANGFLKAGLSEKALIMLKRAERLATGKSKRPAYEYILTLYAACGVKDDVYRIWNLYKETGNPINSGYLCMLKSLDKLDDMDGAEKILEEWESGRNTLFDLRIPNLMIVAYCKKGLFEKAEACIKRLTEKGKELGAITLGCLANGYTLHGQMDKAEEALKRALLARQPGWKPRLYTLAACLKKMTERGEEEMAQEILRSLKEEGVISTVIYNQLQTDKIDEFLSLTTPDEMEDGDDDTLERRINA